MLGVSDVSLSESSIDKRRKTHARQTAVHLNKTSCSRDDFQPLLFRKQETNTAVKVPSLQDPDDPKCFLRKAARSTNGSSLAKPGASNITSVLHPPLVLTSDILHRTIRCATSPVFSDSAEPWFCFVSCEAHRRPALRSFAAPGRQPQCNMLLLFRPGSDWDLAAFLWTCPSTFISTIVRQALSHTSELTTRCTQDNVQVCGNCIRWLTRCWRQPGSHDFQTEATCGPTPLNANPTTTFAASVAGASPQRL